MKDNEAKKFELPSKRRKSIVEYISDNKIILLLGLFILLYFVIVLLFSSIQYLYAPQLIKGGSSDTTFSDLIYFNCVTILTIGYCDLSPTSFYRILAIIEALIGVGFYSLMISIITIKVLVPRKNTIVFSKYAYYCTDPKAFMIIYLNTRKQYLTNVQTLWYYRFKNGWHTMPPIHAPFITNSVQTFYLNYPCCSYEEIVANSFPHDRLRVSITGTLGIATYSTFVEYTPDKILVIKNRDQLTHYNGFYEDVDMHLTTDTFKNYFHYHPNDVKNLAAIMEENHKDK